MKKVSPGFTLLELLIVITIIAILSAIAMVAYSNYLKSARDVRRQSDLKIIQSALERYHANNLNYPADIASLTPSYLSTPPADPIASNLYQYKPYISASDRVSICDNSTPTTQCTRYCLYAKMENSVQKSDYCPDLSGYTLEVPSPD